MGRLPATGVLALVAVMTLMAACGGDSGADDARAPVSLLEAPASILANSEITGIDPATVKGHWAVATDEGLTQVLSFVEGLVLDEDAAREVLAYFEQLRLEVPLEVGAGGEVLLFRVRPRISPRRYVIIVADGSALPVWARDPGPGRSFSSTRPVNVDQVVTFVRLGDQPLAVDAPFEALDAAGRLDVQFIRTACVRSTTIDTDPAAAYAHGAEIHNRGEGVICGVESRHLVSRQIGIDPAAVTRSEASLRTVGFGSDLTLVAPPFDPARYASLPRFGAVFSLR